MKKTLSLFAKILLVIVGFGLIAGFVFAMLEVEERIAVEKECKQLEIKSQNLSFQKQSKIVITEVMSSNSLTILDGFGLSSDWIEFYNSGDEVINLEGAGLSTNMDEPMMWVFPDFEIGPKEYKIVYASGLDEVDSSGNLHLNFKLNAERGETLYFTSALGTLISTIELPAMDSDISYGLNEEGEWLYFNHPTPNEKNGTDGQRTPDFEVYIDSPLMITEYMSHNRSVLYDEDGDVVDWVELYNDSDQPISLENLFFTDDKTDLRKWAFPNIVMEPRSYLLIYASGKDKVTENVHTNFRLADHETLVISNQYSEILVELTIDPLLEDISRGIKDGEWVYFSEPTPGKENSTQGFMEELKPSSKQWDVVINEVMAKNESFLADAHGSYHDWIELMNNSDRDINLKGYSLSKDPEQETAFVFPDYVLPAHGFAVFFADEELDVGGTSVNVPFPISASGETLYLCDVDCDEPQIFETGYLRKNASSGLNEEGERVFFEKPTPKEPNATEYVKRYTAPVEFSHQGGEIPSEQLLELTAEEGAEIYYTLDGSRPTSSDILYRDPVVLDSTKTVRAVAVVEGQFPSMVRTRTYVVGVKHDLPIVALSTDPEHLFGNAGIYSNPGRDIERPVHVELYETEGLALSFDAGFEIIGGTSYKEPQKSFAFHLRKGYGTEEIHYPLFDGNEVTSFRHFLLRTSGQDQHMTKIRDAFIHMAVKDVIDLEVMDSRPCVVYINGEYWGLYNIREKVNEDYLASHHGVDPDQVDLLVWNGLALEGSNEAYKALVKYIETHDMQKPEHYEYVASQIDIDNLIDYLIVESYFGNTDMGNIKFWRDQNGGKWRWILYDMDWALFKGTYTWNNIADIFNPDGMGFDDWIDTTLHVNLMKNARFKEEFIERYALYTRTYFNPERLLPIYDAMVAEIESEMPRQVERWPRNYLPWEDHVAFVRQILIEKPEIEKKHLQSFFGLSDEEMQELFADK
ncbi:MAG: CotH kinase family protein [Anaerolineales bacterium]